MLVILSGCEKNPIGALLYNGVNNSTGWPAVWTLYRNGDLMVSKNSYDIRAYTDYWGTRPNQLNLKSLGASHSGTMSIYVAWDGSPSFDFSAGIQQTGYVGFWIYTENKTFGIDMTGGGYQYLKFWAKGKLNSGVVLRVETEGASSTDPNGAPGVWEGPVSDVWTEYTVQLKQITGVKDAFRIILRNTTSLQSNGGYAYIDDIRFTQ